MGYWGKSNHFLSSYSEESLLKDDVGAVRMPLNLVYEKCNATSGFVSELGQAIVSKN